MIGQKLIPYKGVVTDVNPLYVSDQQTPFLKNVENFESVGIYTPILGNEPFCNLPLPEGRNMVIGSHKVGELSHTYVFCWNSNRNFMIYRLKGNQGNCEKVSVSSCWNFQLDPQHFISYGRCASQVISRYNHTTGLEEKVTYLIFTDNYNPIRFICVEDVIATGGFTTPFFDNPAANAYRCDWFNLGVPTPMDCIKVTPVQRAITIDETTKANLISFKGIEFRIKQINVWGQDSEHGVISSQYISTTGLCIENSSGLSRCLKLNFKSGSPLISKIQVEFRVSKGKSRNVSVASDWFLYDTVEVYDNSLNVEWYNRSRNNPWKKEFDAQIAAGATVQAATDAADAKSLLKYNPTDNSFDYIFCGNKSWTAITPDETNRVQNPIPLTAGSVFSIFKNVGTARHKKGFAPIDQAEIEKIDYTVTKPVEQSGCGTKLRKVVVYAVIYRLLRTDDRITPIYRKSHNSGEQAIYGKSYNSGDPFSVGQAFPADQDGFIGYFAGTNYASVSKQFRYDLNTQSALVEVGVEYPDTNTGFGENAIPIQRWEFFVTPGKYVFRVANQRASLTTDFRNTSALFGGQTNLTNSSNIGVDIPCKEIVIDACTQDVDLLHSPIVIYDVSDIKSGVNCGYLLEDEVERRPIDGAIVQVEGTAGDNSFAVVHSGHTDYNGFYWAVGNGIFSGLGSGTVNVKLLGKSSCASNTEVARKNWGYAFNDLTGKFVEDTLFAYHLSNLYPTMDRILIKGRVTLCGSPQVGVAGVAVVATNCRPATTDSNGDFTIIAHDNGDGSARTETLIYSQRGLCKIVTCASGCDYCFPNQTINFPPCNGVDRTIITTSLSVRIRGLNLKGATMGGRYQIGFAVENWLGQMTFVQTSDKHFVDIPTLQETKVFDYSKIGFTIDPSFRLPAGSRNMSFFITDNLNQDDFMTWTVDRIQYIDAAGNENKTAPSYLRLYYESLGEFNKLHKFSTTTGWQFISQASAPVIGDQIEILANGDGTILNCRSSTLVSYDQEGTYIQIEYTEDMKDLKAGALIKLIRPVQGETAQFFYELCPVIKVVDGVPQTLSGTFDFVDSYLLSRQIPVPIAKKTKKDAVSGAIIETDENINELRSYPFLFEHPSPSDFWGDHCRGRGRINVKNIYENVISANTEVALSKALSNDGILNGLHYFSETDFTQFDENEWGGIVAVIPELSYLLMICERDNFVVGYNDNTLRFDQKTGKAYAASADQKFGRPERKVGNNFGCDMNDINSIQKENGIVAFVDRSNNALVFHNYSEGQDVTLAGNRSWIEDKVQMVCNTPGKYFIGGIDPRKADYLLSTFDIKDVYTDADFINDLPELSPGTNETVVVNLMDRAFHFVSFTPECFAQMSGSASGQQLICFKQGKAFKHNRTSTPYMNFFGVQCKPRIWGVANIENTKEKKFGSIEVYCNGVNLVAYKVTTESGQISRIKQTWWQKAETFYKAPFLCDLNTPTNNNLVKETGQNKLLDGNLLYGLWLMVGLTTLDVEDGKYFEYTGMIIFVNPSEKSST